MMKSDMASQPVLTSYKLLEIERQPLIKDFDLWIKPCRHERAHGQHGAHMRGKRSQGKLIQNQWVNFLGFAHRLY